MQSWPWRMPAPRLDRGARIINLYRRVPMLQSIERDPGNVSHQFADKGRVKRADVLVARNTRKIAQKIYKENVVGGVNYDPDIGMYDQSGVNTASENPHEFIVTNTGRMPKGCYDDAPA
ncbi:unnamed protein product, partial [Brenthis ino]